MINITSQIAPEAQAMTTPEGVVNHAMAAEPVTPIAGFNQLLQQLTPATLALQSSHDAPMMKELAISPECVESQLFSAMQGMPQTPATAPQLGWQQPLATTAATQSLSLPQLQVVASSHSAPLPMAQFQSQQPLRTMAATAAMPTAVTATPPHSASTTLLPLLAKPTEFDLVVARQIDQPQLRLTELLATSQVIAQHSQAPVEAKMNWATVPLASNSAQMGEQMLNVLQERVQMQASQHIQEVRIRFDPPDMGKLDLLVKVDGDKLNVQINANNGMVRDVLAQVSERLRMELQAQHFVDVNVNVGAEQQEPHQGQSASPQPEHQTQILTAQAELAMATNIAFDHGLLTTA